MVEPYKKDQTSHINYKKVETIIWISMCELKKTSNL